MIKLFLCFSLVFNFFSQISAVYVEGSAITTRYFDCCLPSCSYPSKADYSSLLKSIKADGSPGNANGPSGCISTSKDASFTDSKQAPLAIDDNHSIGFVATGPLNGKTEKDLCCTCVELTFTSGPVNGKTMTVQITNTGQDIQNSDHFDIAIPGAGAGIFTQGCPNQYGAYNFGAQYGGVSNSNECDNLPNPQKAGCKWRFDWFKNADNPSVTYKSVACPASIINISGCVNKNSADTLPSLTIPSVKPVSAPTVPDPKPVLSPTIPDPKPVLNPTIPTSNKECSKEWLQCDGKNFSGNKCCIDPLKCIFVNDYWSSCQYAKDVSCVNNRYQQCGGQNYKGLTCCPNYTKCVKVNEYYSQCI